MAKTKPPVTRIEDSAEPETTTAAETTEAPEEAKARTEQKAEPKPKVAPKVEGAAAATGSAEADDAPAARLGLTARVAQVFPGHEHAVIGGVAGLLVAILFFLLGFWRTVLVCLLVCCGVAIGQYLDGDPRIVNLLRRALGEGRGGN